MYQCVCTADSNGTAETDSLCRFTVLYVYCVIAIVTNSLSVVLLSLLHPQ
jgi:hypothetical protein